MQATPAVDLVRMDRARVIRRSSRCLLFGLVGCLPLVGVVPAVLALRLYGRVLRETGEVRRPRRVLASWGVAALFAWGYAWGFGVGGFLLVTAVGLTLQAAAWVEVYRHPDALAWNPARGRATLGAALAITGLAMLGLLAELSVGLGLRSWYPLFE